MFLSDFSIAMLKRGSLSFLRFSGKKLVMAPKEFNIVVAGATSAVGNELNLFLINLKVIR